MMEAPFTLSIPQPVAPAESPPEMKPPLMSPSDTLTRNLAAFMQSNGMGTPAASVVDLAEQLDQRHPSLQAALQQHLNSFGGFAGLASPTPINPTSCGMTSLGQLSCANLSPEHASVAPTNIAAPQPLPAPIPTNLTSCLTSSLLDGQISSLQSAFQHNMMQNNNNNNSNSHNNNHLNAAGNNNNSPPLLPQPPTGLVQQIPRADIVTVQPRKPPAGGGRGSVGLAVHVDGYLYHGKKTRLDGTKLLYCLDRTKYNCMAVAELFPNGTFRAKRPHTGHPPNPEECEVRLAKRMMRERAREHPEYSSKEIIREMINDPTISEEAKKRLENYESLRKFVYRGRQQAQRRPKMEHPPAQQPQQPQPPQLLPIKMEEGSAFSLPNSLAALFSQNLAQNIANLGAANGGMCPNLPAPTPLGPEQKALLMTSQDGQLGAAQDEIARLMRELHQQNARTVEEIRVKNHEFAGTVEPSTSNASSAAASSSTVSAPLAPSSCGIWHTVDCDVIDFSRMPDGDYHYIFHAKDVCSRFSFACPMVGAGPADLLDALRLCFFTYGPAHVVRVDQTYQNLEQELAVHFPLTAVEHLIARKNPSGGLVQSLGGGPFGAAGAFQDDIRHERRREAAMMKERIFAWLMESGRKDWARALPQIKYAHNTEWIDEIECTPLEKFFSRNLPTGMSSRYSEENNESHDGMSEDGEEVSVGGPQSAEMFINVKDELMQENN